MQSSAFAQLASTTVARLRSAFRAGRTRSLESRREHLLALRALLDRHADAIREALWADLRKPAMEVEVSETGFVIAEIDYALKRLARWMKPERVRVPLVGQAAEARVRHEPVGVVLIVGAWNYPINLILTPLVGALAGGNVALVKPSEISARTSRLIAGLAPRYFDPEVVAVIEGGPDEMRVLLQQEFDHIFFTGSAPAAKHVLEAAAGHFTPVTLELGGKSPCLVDRTADLAVAARRIAWGKFANAGQTCVAPDYVLVHEAVEEKLLVALREALRGFYGDDPRQSPDYGRIVNDRQYERLVSYLNDGEIFSGGQTEARERYLAPTILRNVSPSSPVMREEIFGPILPVLAVPDLGVAVDFVNQRPRPLAIYLFSDDRDAQRQVVEGTTSGDVCINEVVLQLAVPGLPFGGVGPSGMGAYHGRWSFETFTRARGVLRKSLRFDVPLRYPPYSEWQRRWIRRLMLFSR